MFQENNIETCILSRVKQITGPGWMHETSTGALGGPGGSGWGGRWEGGSGWGRHVNPTPFHFNVWQNSLQKKKKKSEDSIIPVLWSSRSQTLLTFKAWCSGSPFLVPDPWARGLMWAQKSHSGGKDSATIMLQFVGHPLPGDMGFDNIMNPPLLPASFLVDFNHFQDWKG